VPTGIISAELTARRVIVSTRTCPDCLAEGLDPEDRYCRRCGSALPEPAT